jgi:hypothetical protein
VAHAGETQRRFCVATDSERCEHLIGGIDHWAEQGEPTMARY